MKDTLRLLALFLLAVLVMTGAYGMGFATALRVDETPAVTALRERLAPVVGRIAGVTEGQSTSATSDAGGEEGSGAGAPAGAGSHASSADFDAFWDAWRTVQTEYDGKLPEDDEITYGVIRGSMKSLDDPYTNFFDPVVTEINRPTLEGEFEGIGAYVTSNEQGQLVIQTPMRGQPAEKAGVKAGDIVIRVDGEDISGLDLNEAVLLIRGPKGTKVTLTILRDGVDGELVIPVVRDKIEVPSVNDVRLLEAEGAPEVGYIQITSFAAETTDELVRAIDELREKGAQALVLDLRNNPGGFLNTAIDVSSQFIGEGIIVQQEDNRKNRRTESAKPGGHALDLPLVVLINKGSASASEIVAGAIRDHERGVLVGETSFGKGSVQNVHEMADGSELRVTVAAWLTPNGSHIHKHGIEPDVEVLPEEPQANAAAEGGDQDGQATDGSTAPEATPGAEDGATPTDATPAPDAAASETPPDVQLLRAIEEAKQLLAGRG